MAAGDAKSDFWWLVIVLIVLGLAWFATGGTTNPEARRGLFLRSPLSDEGGGPGGFDDDAGASQDGPLEQKISAVLSAVRSPYFDRFSIGRGNARYESRPNHEYVVIAASRSNASPVNVSGWQLKNSPDRRGGRGDTVLLPAIGGAPILLPPSGELVVVTGAPPASNRWPLGYGFRLNHCTGYLAEDFAQFRMTPALSRQCPRPADEPGAGNLPEECYDFVQRLSSCHTPKFETKSDGYLYLDNRLATLSSFCRAYLKEHFSYDRCVAWHQNDPDFYTDEWRVYLNRFGELWGKNRETVALYDNFGKLVDSVQY